MGLGRQFGGRFLETREFLRYSRELRLVETGFETGLLGFLEEQQLLLPIVRVRFSPPVVRSLYAEFRFWARDLKLLERESDSAVVEAAAGLHHDIGGWGGVLRVPRWHHVLDVVPPECVRFVISDPGSQPFVPLRERRVHIGSREGRPVLTSDFQPDFYRYWQVLQLAEILAMRVEILTDLRIPDIADAAKDWKLDGVRGGKQLRWVPRQQANVLDSFCQFQAEWEAVAYAYAYSRRSQQLRWLAAQAGKPDPVTIDSRFGEGAERVAVDEALRRFRTTEEKLMDFLRWQCTRWDYWNDSDRQLIAEEYRFNISATVEAIAINTNKKFEQIADDVGRVTGHFKPTLKVVLPDWVEDCRDDLVDHLKRRIPEISERYGPAGVCVDPAALNDFADWIESEKLFQVFFHYETLANLNVRADSVAQIGYAKEAVALALTVEHAVNVLIQQSDGAARPTTLLPKLQLLWRKTARISKSLGEHASLTRTNTVSFDVCWKQIDGIPGGSGADAITKDLLRSILIRNEGSHRGLVNLSREAIRETVGLLLEVILLCWLETERRRIQ